MKKLTFGTPEPLVPSRFCEEFHYEETPVSFDATQIAFRKTRGGVLLEYKVPADTRFYGCGLQFWEFDHAGVTATCFASKDGSVSIQSRIRLAAQPHAESAPHLS